MAYDGLGRRIVKAVRHCADLDGTFHDYYNGQQLVETRNGSDIWMKQQVWGLDDVDELVQTTVHIWSAGAEQPYWILQDANYNVLAAIEGGSYGKVAERYEYTPYGQRQVFQPSGSSDPGAFAPTLGSQTASDLGATVCDFGHQGLMHDAATGLVYNRARMLHPRLGRFMQRDPLGYVDGMSVYEYVRCRPTVLTDARGLESGWETWSDSTYWSYRLTMPPKMPAGELVKMEYTVAFDYKCDEENKARGRRVRIDHYNKSGLDKLGWSTGPAGVVVQDWVDVSAEEFGAGATVHQLELTMVATWKHRASVGLNPGLGPFAWDIGLSVGKTKKRATKRYECVVDCCKKGRDGEPNVTCDEVKSWLDHSHPLYASFEVSHDGWPNDDTVPDAPPEIGPTP
ncbi:MAG: RHS repeat-associated core domain-containing protein [Phycisphaeraceae bacterium]